MDKAIKEETDNQDEEISQPPNEQPVAKDEEPHETHSFEWCWDKTLITFTCDKAGTVEDLLKRSSLFTKNSEKNKTKELVIIRDGKAISSHFPCSLIKNERLTVKYVKAVDEQKQSVSSSVDPQRKRPASERVIFNVVAKGGEGVVKIMRNTALEPIIQEVTVFAYKGENVTRALRRDGRFQDKVFEKNCVLSNISTKVITEMSSLVDDLEGKTFKIILLNKLRKSESQPGSLDDADMMQSESQRSESDGNQDPPQQSTTAESVNAKGKPKPNDKMARDENQETMQCLSSQFQLLHVSKLPRMENLFPVEYGKDAQTCREVKTMKKLMELSDSVCQVRVNGRPEGSGFLLFDRFVLTNGHVVKNIYNKSTKQLNERVTVHFSFESLDQTEGRQESGEKVEEVVGFEHCPDVSGHMYNWALLKLSTDQTLPDCLLTRFGFLPQSGEICIIGHPDCGVKKIDPCLIIPADNRNQGGSHCLESCSSGSPVFDKHCNVVAMHSGGFAYHSEKGETQSVIEFGHPLSVIIEHIMVQMVESGRFDVLKKYLACDYAHQQAMMSSLKKLVESRNLTVFQNAAKHPKVTCDESLKTFFEFFSQKEEPAR